MSGAGSMQSMNTSLKTNRKLLRKSYFSTKHKTFLNRKREYYAAAGGVENIRTATKEELLEIRQKIITKRKKENFVTIIIALIFISLVVYFSISFFKDNTDYKTPNQKQLKIDQKQYSFFISSGDSYLSKSQWHNAVFQYTRAQEIYPNDYHASYRIAYAFVYSCRNTNKNCEAAEYKLKEIMEKYPNKPELIELEQVLIFAEAE